MRYSKSLLLVSTCGLVFLGCAHKSGADLDKFSQNYYTQQHQKADALSKELIAKDKKQRDASLWNLENGVNAFMAGNYKDSLNTLDKANKTFDTNWKNMEKGLAKVGAATFGSATNVPYEGHMYEWTLTNYYMALDYAFMDKFNEARVEFNRTVDRQRRIKEAYAKQIAKVNAEMEKAKKKDGNKAQGMEKSMKGLDQELSKRYSSLEQFKAYDGFINPMVSYVAGLFYSTNGDSKGIDDLKEAYGISQIPLLAQDIKHFENHDPKKMTWVIVEDGMQPTLEEFKITEFNFALPLLKPGKDFHKTFQISASGKAENLAVLSHFNAVVQKEYQTTLPAIKARAITSAILKTGAEAGLVGGGAAVGGSAGLAMQATGAGLAMLNKATTAADIRSSNVFPNTVYAGRVDSGTDFSLVIDGASTPFKFVTCAGKSAPSANQVCSDANNIIFVRTFPVANTIKVLTLK
ncbi:hypothetical protein [Helicobacter felis]|uniref:hypothetical protein n=1 Tax=Helicobacter felis TaxID=214 RepID=UPI001F20F2D0|nr:hypothetical protein [Helicobacter felis]